MSMSLYDVREGIAENLRNNVQAVKVYAYVPESISTPAIIVGYPKAWSFHKAFKLEGEDDLEVWVLVGRAQDRAAQELLASYVSPDGIAQAIEADTTLGGACQAAYVTHVDSFSNYTVGSTEYLGCKFHVRIVG